MDFKGSIVVTRGTDRVIRVKIDERASGSRFVEVVMTYEQFAEALTGLVSDCDLDIRNLDKIGKRREVITVIFKDIPDVYDRDTPEWIDFIKKVTAPYVAQGWECRRGDFFNDHNRFRMDGKRCVKVTMVRFVDDEKEEAL